MKRTWAWLVAGLVLGLGACGQGDEPADGQADAGPAPQSTAAAPPENEPAAPPQGEPAAPEAQAAAEPPGAAPIEGLPDELNTLGCFACHGMNEVRIGPPYRAIAGMYRNQDGAAEKLTRKVIEGGGGVWGPVPMISHPQLTEAQVRPLIEAILAIQ